MNTKDTIYCPFCTKPCKGDVGFWSHAKQMHRRGMELILKIDPPQTREEWDDERDQLLERISQLEGKLYGFAWEPPAELKLTAHEVAILQTLMAHDRVVSHDLIYDVTRNVPNAQPSADDKIVHIRICIMRRKFREFGLEILTAVAA